MVCEFPTTLDSKDSPLHFSDGTASPCCCAFSVMPLACKHAYLKLACSSVAPRSSVRSRNGGHKRDSKCRAHSSWATTQLKCNSISLAQSSVGAGGRRVLIDSQSARIVCIDASSLLSLFSCSASVTLCCESCSFKTANLQQDAPSQDKSGKTTLRKETPAVRVAQPCTTIWLLARSVCVRVIFLPDRRGAIFLPDNRNPGQMPIAA